MRQTSPLVYPAQQPIRHGVQYIPREKQPSMFEILTWKEKYDAASDNNWLVRLNQGNKEGRFTEQHKYERFSLTQAHSPNNKGKSGNVYHRQVKQGLYDYGEDEVKKKVETASPKQPKEKAKKEAKKLSRFNEQQKKQIEIRMKNIQHFHAFTRELPNSAFTTYFGKPAFEHYGFGSGSRSTANLKSHSVMPHAGKNHPQEVQSHEGALKKANVINLESHVPRIKVQSPPVECKVNVKEYYNVEIVKPDLVNELRFANDDRDLKFKSKTPRHNELNYLPKRQYKSPVVGPQRQVRKKAEKSQEKGEKLAFMNGREQFMREVSEKRKMQNRLAYKVTECHPYNWDHQTSAASTAKEQQWRQVRPAGISSSSLDARNFLSY